VSRWSAPLPLASVTGLPGARGEPPFAARGEPGARARDILFGSISFALAWCTSSGRTMRWRCPSRSRRRTRIGARISP